MNPILCLSHLVSFRARVWQLTVKAMCKEDADVSMVQHCTPEQLKQQLPATAAVAAPPCLASAAQLSQELYTVIEVK